MEAKRLEQDYNMESKRPAGLKGHRSKGNTAYLYKDTIVANTRTYLSENCNMEAAQQIVDIYVRVENVQASEHSVHPQNGEAPEQEETRREIWRTDHGEDTTQHTKEEEREQHP
jgi:hypothetical protein